MRKFFLASALILLAVVYLFAISTSSDSRYSQYFWAILSFMVAVDAGFLAWTGVELRRLLKRRKQAEYGSGLAFRLMKRFVAVALIPAAFLFVLCLSFILYSINSWYNDVGRSGLTGSMNLSRMSTDLYLENVSIKAGALRQNLIDNYLVTRNFSTALALLPQRKEYDQIGLFDADTGNLVVSETTNSALPWPELNAAVLASLDEGKGTFGKNAFGVSDDLYAGVWMNLLAADPKGPNGVKRYALFVNKRMPERLSTDALRVEQTAQRYDQLVYYNASLQKFFALALALVTLLSVLFATLMSTYFTRKFVEPLRDLTDATNRISEGDLSASDIKSDNKDEIGRLATNFNLMTRILVQTQKSNEQLIKMQEQARIFQDRVFESLTAGVLAFDADDKLTNFNPSSGAILGFPLLPLIGSTWQSWAGDDEQQIRMLHEFVLQLVTHPETGSQMEHEYAGADRIVILNGRMAKLPSASGMVIVFDDVTKLVSVQKEAAWGEVARRLAHEIANPLTPIQLSAERLKIKLSDKLDEKDAGILDRCTSTIIAEVSSLQRMVEEFRHFARNAGLNLEKIDFNDLVEQVLALYGAGGCEVRKELVAAPLPAMVDSKSMRQVLHNLLKNASESALEAAERDEKARQDGQDGESRPKIAPAALAKTELLGNGMFAFSVSDNGAGFSPEMLKRAFEPYVTSKKNGTGLGLSVVKKLVEEHGGEISISNEGLDGRGARVTIKLHLMEK